MEYMLKIKSKYYAQSHPFSMSVCILCVRGSLFTITSWIQIDDHFCSVSVGAPSKSGLKPKALEIEDCSARTCETRLARRLLPRGN